MFTAESDFNQTFIMFIMKTELLVSLLCVTLSISAAAVVPVEDVPEYRDVQEYGAAPEYRAAPEYGAAPEYRAAPEYGAAPEYRAAPVPVEAAADVREEKAELSIPVKDEASVALENALRANVLQRVASNCPQGWQRYGEHCYLLVNLTYSRINAEFLCENLNSSLASAHNLWEYNFLQRLTWKAGFLTAWIGGYRFQGYWRWDDGTPFKYNNWFSHDSSSYDECIYLNSEGVKGWSNDGCTNGHSFICSFKLKFQ